MAKKLTILQAIEEFELDTLYSDIMESYGENLEDPSLVSDLYDLIDESEEEYEFSPDQDGDYSESFERNLIEAIHSIVEENEELEFSDDYYYDDDDIPEMIDGNFEKSSKSFGVDIDDGEAEDDEEDDIEEDESL